MLPLSKVLENDAVVPDKPPVSVPPALGNAALAVVLAELAVVVVVVNTPSLVAMSTPSTKIKLIVS